MSDKSGTKNITPEFLVGSHAIFTVGGPKKHYTYKITKKPNQPFCVFLLTGKDNTCDYRYFGCYIPNTSNKKYLKITTRSRVTLEAEVVKVFVWAAHIVVKDKEVPEGYSILHAGKCAACGRKLTTPDSIEKGFGPHCYKYIKEK